MKKLNAEVATTAGALVLLVSLVGMVWSFTVDEVVGPLSGGGMAVGFILMGWGVFNSFNAQGSAETSLSESVERIRVARLS